MKRKSSKKNSRHLKLVYSKPVKKQPVKPKLTLVDVFIIGLLLGSTLTLGVVLW